MHPRQQLQTSTDTLLLEFSPFDVKVIELKTGAVQAGFCQLANHSTAPKLLELSMYGIARETV